MYVLYIVPSFPFATSMSLFCNGCSLAAIYSGVGTSIECHTCTVGKKSTCSFINNLQNKAHALFGRFMWLSEKGCLR